MTRVLLSWTGQPPSPQTPHEVHWRSDISPTLSSLLQSQHPTIAYGNGRSYGDVCYATSNQAIRTRPLNRCISADWQQGIIRAEAGATFAELLEHSVPKGWFLPVTPGTKFVTLGGAIANDVHGKNHHRRGTLGRHLRAFSLIRSDHSATLCTPDTNNEFYNATIGGLGLSGIIEWAELQLIPIRSAAMETKTQRFGTLDEFMSLSDEWDKTHEYGVAWVDGTATATALGRGIYIAANHADNGPLQPHNNEAMSVPFTPPIGVINPLTTRAFNAVNWNLHSKRSTNRRQAYDPYFYPLDRLNHWNRLYGKRGFQQFQCVIPEANAQAGLKELLRVISNSGQASFLTVLKRCGDIPSPGLMSFPMPGISLAIDFPMSPTLIRATLPTLDKIVREAKGRLYPAKDAHMSGEDFRNAYPAWQQVEALRDPALMSQFWARVIS